MSMNLFYQRINWENYPSLVTPINEINLNKLDYAAKTLDERTVELYNTKAEQSVVLNTIKDWSMDSNTGIINITKVNGEQIFFDLNIEKIPVSFSLSEDGILTMTTDDGSIFTANIMDAMPIITFENSETISAHIISGRTQLATDFSEYVHEFAKAFTGRIVIEVVPVEGFTPIDQYSATAIHSDGSITSYGGAGIAEEYVFDVEDSVKITVKTESSNNIVALYTEVGARDICYKFEVKDGSIKDNHLEPNYLANIKIQADNAKMSESASAASAISANESSLESKSYAVGGTGTREGEDTDNAKYYAEKAKELKESFEFPTRDDVIINRQTLGYTKKNLLKINTLSGTANGITYNSNANSGIITFNGTPTSDVILDFNERIYLKAGIYKFNGCPEGGNVDGVKRYKHIVFLRKSDGSYLSEVNDFGNGASFTITQKQVNNGVFIQYTVNVFKDYTGGNLIFKPMIRSAEIEDGTFEPYVDDVDTRLKALTPVNNFLATVPGSPLDAVMGKELNDMIVALEERLKWKRLTVPEPILDTEGYIRTYEIDLSSYTEVEINLFIANYGQFSTYRCCLSGGGDYGYIYFLDEYTDQNGYSFGARLRVYRNKIEVYTLPSSTNPTLNYIVVHGIMAR